MKKLLAIVGLALAAPGCVPGGGARPAPKARSPREVSVTIYSVPPWEPKDEWDFWYVDDRWREERERRDKENRRVAVQMRAFAERSEWGDEVTPYGMGVVQDERDIELGRGVSEYRFSDVASQIEPDTVHFTCLSDPRGTQVLEQNYEYDLVNAEALLEKYIDHDVAITLESGTRVKGRLLSADDLTLVLRTGDDETEIVEREPDSRISFSELPGGLVTRPRLAWLVASRRAGKKRVKVSYRTRGLMWEAGYTALLSEDEKTLSFTGVATIGNASGARYDNARLKLLAGEVNMVDPVEPLEEAGAAGFGCAGGINLFCAAEAEPVRFEEKSFLEYHLYTLGRPCTIANNEVKQIEIFPPVPRVPVRKKYVYYGALPTEGRDYLGCHMSRDPLVRCNSKVDIYLDFRNDEDSGLGMPLPAGPVRILKRDPTDGEAEFIGEDLFDHTPRNEEITLRLGTAFDIVGERVQTDFRADYDACWMEETVEIRLRNHKAEDVEVLVKETMYRWLNWEITGSSCEWVRDPPLPPTKDLPPPEWHKVLLKGAKSRTATFEFVDTPLKETLAFLTQRYGAKVALDLRPNDWRDELPINLKVREMPLPTALERIAEQATLACGLHGGKVILTADPAKLTTTRAYDASVRGASASSVAEVIQSYIEPDSWAAELGTSIEERDGTLIVVQTPHVHKKVEKFLAELGGKLDSRTVIFVVPVPADGEKKITYTVRYSW